MTDNDVKCKDCEFLMFSDCYGECSKAYKGIVSPNDSCGKGMRKGGNMTDNEIIKALERCVQYTTTDVRTYKGMPLEAFSQAVLDLINRKIADIDALQSKCDSLRSAGNSLKMHLKKAEEECQNQSVLWRDHFESIFESAKETIRAESIKEFAKRLKEEGKKNVDKYTPEGCDLYFANGTLCGYVAMKETIDNLVKEMTGGSE